MAIATKNNCPSLQKAGDDEPIFVLRGQDILASDLVRAWAEQARAHGLSTDKYHNAMAQADAMEMWKNRKYPD